MAATAVGIALPIIEVVAPKIIDLITKLIHKSASAAEVTYGPETGPVKFGAVFADVIDALTKAAIAGQIAKQLPSDPAIQIIIQAVVTSMKLSGLLGTSAALASTLPGLLEGALSGPVGKIPPPAANWLPQPIILKAGQSVLISVA